MGKKDESKKFTEKFKELTPENQRYIIGIQQALIFAQKSGSCTKYIEHTKENP